MRYYKWIENKNKLILDKENGYFSFSNKEEFQPSLPAELSKCNASQLFFNQF